MMSASPSSRLPPTTAARGAGPSREESDAPAFERGRGALARAELRRADQGPRLAQAGHEHRAAIHNDDFEVFGEPLAEARGCGPPPRPRPQGANPVHASP